MRILVIGRKGQLARKLALESGREFVVRSAGRPELDICRKDTIAGAIGAHEPDIVINAAAYTAVDKAESEPDAAYAVNRDGAGNVAAAAADAGLPVIHVSTDYVFSGEKPDPYVEEDETGPTGVYGASKLAGEHAVAAANPKHLIVRTAWVYSDVGQNFARTMLRLAGNRDRLTVVADQIGNPTSARDLARGLLHAASSVTSRGGSGNFGIRHLTGRGGASWAEFAREIYAVSRDMGGPWCDVADIPTRDYPTPARRPANSRLSNEKFEECFNWKMPAWKNSCRDVVRLLVDRSKRP